MCYDVQHNKVILNLEPTAYREHEVLEALLQMISRFPTLKLAVWHGPVA
jgi:hypothetical protein